MIDICKHLAHNKASESVAAFFPCGRSSKALVSWLIQALLAINSVMPAGKMKPCLKF